MQALGAYYGSDSDASDTEVAAAAPPPPKKPAIVVPKLSPKPAIAEESEPKLNLPTASSYSLASSLNNKEDEIDSTASIQRRDWEIKIAEEEKKNLPKSKKKIAAFGGLSSKAFEKEAEDDDDVIQKPQDRPIFSSQSKSAFLSALPPPKTVQTSKSQTSTLSFLPSTIKLKTVSKPAPAPKMVPKPAPKEESDDEGDSNNANDFLGLDSLPKSELLDIASLPKPEYNIPNMFLIDEPIGPARPPPATFQEESPSEASTSSTTLKRIDDDAAKKLIYKQEIEQWGTSNIYANDAVSGMIDVSVDRQLGPNVHQTLLKNIDHRSMAAFAASKEQRQAGGKKGPSEKLAKMKHQITHLASIALSRQDELKEQWAASRESKAASKRKYGF